MSTGLKLLMLSLLLIGCKNNDKENYYIYLSHTRLNDNTGVIKEVYDIDFTKYDLRLLGGDLAKKTFKDSTIISHLDSLFNFKSKKTIWSIGNHDVTSNKNYYKTTGRNKYYSYQKNNTTFIVLDSQDSLSSIVNKQKEFLFNTLDTLSTNNVLILSHKLIFMDQHPTMDSLINKVCNGKKGDRYHLHNKNNFQEDIYPKILNLVQRGVSVTWVGGDLGHRMPSYKFIDKNGVLFLGNGMSNRHTEGNEVIIFYNKNEGQLKHKFVQLKELLEMQYKPNFYEKILKHQPDE